MLRTVALALAIANLVFLGWSRGWLDSVVGVRAQGDREPARLARQFEPDAIRILPPQPAGAGAVQPPVASAPTARLCLEAGPFTPTQLGPAEASLQTLLPSDRWSHLKFDSPAVWIIFMGRYSDREVRQKKLEELQQSGVMAEEIRGPADLGEGLLLGRFSERSVAEKSLSALAQRGVRPARVALLSPASTGYLLRVERADAALQAQLNSLQGIALLGRVFKACTPPAR